MRRLVYGTVVGGWYVENGQRIAIKKKVPPTFADPIWLDPLTQYFDGGLYRLWPSERYLSRGGQKLHRDVWTAAFGSVPAGCHIHHKDADPTNNALKNLACLPAGEHLSMTGRNNPHGPTKTALEAAAAWHRSEAGRLWHSRQALREKNWTKWKRTLRPCANCGTEFMALVRKNGHEQKFCSPNCKAAYYRKHA